MGANEVPFLAISDHQTALSKLQQLAASPAQCESAEMPPTFIAPCPTFFRSSLRRPQLSAPAPPAWPTAAPIIARDSSYHQLHRPSPGDDFHGIPNPPPGVPLLLSDLRERLIRQEETIIFALIERAQFKKNSKIYVPGAFDIPSSPHWSFSQFLLYELEKVYAKVRRYTSPDEHAFSPPGSLPKPILSDLDYPQTLKKNRINVNSTIEKVYKDSILPRICEEGDDQNYGSSAACDVACLQALSKRIHYGKFIAEAKCQADDSLYRRLAARRDRTKIWNELSNISVECVLLKRVENKAKSYGSDISGDGARDIFKVEPHRISEMYRDFIIPLTKEVEVEYIIQRYEGIDYQDGEQQIPLKSDANA
ncbi:Chorismate mutase 3, chloroplastic [Gracilariopsis chorda]|uniref:chorismate mutase n=1 Tax=Gracilariopsis chorda TaxID=448386 RepID=A0A2V3INL5_9FLOR|nr:Chorismate mutase 3, chloroplastic [Gracilariopsis chorda]|eukprot:PXF43647.1 Chorismate mutase 3, chloroplastic [Gracilariopsis chorda]